MIKSLCNIFDCFLEDYENETYVESITEIDMRSQLEGIFLFSCIWSIGGLLKGPDKQDFDVLIRALQCKEFPKDVQGRFHLSDNLISSPTKQYDYTAIPDFATVFDYMYIKEGKGKWELWSENVITPSVIPRDLQFRQIIVPTRNTIRNQHLISLLTRKRKSVLLIGDRAAGKTTDVTYFLNSKLDTNIYKPIFLNFTSCTTGNNIQHLMNCKLSKRKRGVYGPPLGLKYVLFVDDLNAAKADTFGTNSAIEFLRHWIEFGHWYNLDDASLVQIIDVQFICALTSWPTGGRNTLLCPRLTKYFNIVYNNTFDDETLKSIFSKIMLWHLDTRGFSKEFDPCIDQIVEATLSIHRLVQNKLLPIPDNPHYIFNLRDFSRVIQGVVLSVPEAIEDLSAMKRLWVHEVIRIYHDRITDKNDSEWFFNTLKTVAVQHLKEDLNSVLQHLTNKDTAEVGQGDLRKLVFCDFINPKADVRNYTEVQDMDSLESIIEGYLAEYNNVNKKQLNLLLFSHAIEHISRICRIIKQSQSHALLFGDYGSGKQSLARLAIHMCEYELFEIELSNNYNENNWRDDMKHLLRTAYTDQHAAFLLCTNIQVFTNSMLDDVSNLLQFAEIPEIFNTEEKNEICEKMEVIDNQREKSLQTDGSHEALFNLFLRRLKRQIHIVLVVNSSTYDFRKLIYKYPSFINCCTLDWFEPWSFEIQMIVGKKLLRDVKWEYSDLQLVIESCNKLFHLAKQLPAELFGKSTVQLNFTQKSFVRMVITFRNLFTKKRSELLTLKHLYDKALQRLLNIKEQIPVLEYEHQLLQPEIIIKRGKVKKLESAIEAQKEMETEAEIAVNGAKTFMKNCEKGMKFRQAEYDKRLQEIKNFRENAIESLQALSSNDITVLKTMKSPPKPVRLVAEALVYLKELKTEKIQEAGKVIEDFWKPAIKMICDSKFVGLLINLNPVDVSARTLKYLEERIIFNEDFDADKIRNYSIAAEGIYKWISVIYEFNKLTKLDSNVRIQLLEAEGELTKAEKNLVAKEKTLEEIRRKRKSIEIQLVDEKQKLNTLEKKESTYGGKKVRANDLVKILNGKREYWLEKSNTLEETRKTLLGDIVLCSAVLSYLTALPQELRNMKTMEWHACICESGLLCSSPYDFSTFLLDEMEIEKLKSIQIIDDCCFQQNLAILRNSSRYPLLIDPDDVLTSWIENVEHEQELIVIKVEHEDYLRKLENAITSGSPALLEHLNDTPDSLLFTLFDKQIFKSSNCHFVKLGKHNIEFNPNFRLYLSTKNQEINFDSEIFEKLAIVNCSISKLTVENNLLKTIVKKNSPELEIARSQSIGELINLKKISSELELTIIQILADGKDILEGEAEINVLATSARLVEENSKKISDLSSRIDSINCTINEYRVFSQYFSNLFKILENIPKMNSKYHFSLKWFEILIDSVMDQLDNKAENSKKLNFFKELSLQSYYFNVCHFLIDEEKMVFGFLLAFFQMSMNEENMNEELNFFFRFLRNHVKTFPKRDVIAGLNDLRKLIKFKEVFKDFENSEDIMKKIFEQNSIPNEWLKILNSFQKFVLNVCVHPENLITYLRTFITSELKINTLNEDQSVLHTVYKESKCYLPISLIMFDLSDPTKSLFNFAVDIGIPLEKCFIITAGQLENFSPLDLVSVGKSNGSWFIFRNLQYSPDLFIEIQKIIEALSPTTVHPDFRLWFILRSELPCPEFILNNTFKVVFKMSSIRTNFEWIRNELYNRLNYKKIAIPVGNEYAAYQKLVRFHGILMDTSYLYPWISRPRFNDTDLIISLGELMSQVEVTENMDIDMIKSFFRDCCYGNKLQHEWDRSCLLSAVDKFLSNNIKSELSESIYELENDILDSKTEVETELLIKCMLKLDYRHSEENLQSENMIQIISNLEKKIPPLIPLDFRTLTNQTQDIFMTVAIEKEIQTFNSFVKYIGTELSTLKQSLKGHCWFTDELEILWRNLRNGYIKSTLICQSEINLSLFADILLAKYQFLDKFYKHELEEINLSAIECPHEFMLLNLLQYYSNCGRLLERMNLDTWLCKSDAQLKAGRSLLFISCNITLPLLIHLLCMLEYNLIKTFISHTNERNLVTYRLAPGTLNISNALWNEKNEMLNFNSKRVKTNQVLPLFTIKPAIENGKTNEGTYVCPVYKILNAEEYNKSKYIISVAFPVINSPFEFLRRRANINIISLEKCSKT